MNRPRVLGLATAAAFAVLALLPPLACADGWTTPPSGAQAPATPLARRDFLRPACAPSPGGRRTAAPGATYARRRPSPWRVSVALPVWIPGVSGELGSGDVVFDVERGTSEITDNLFEDAVDLQFGFVGQVEVAWRDWFLSFEGFGARLGSAVTFRLIDGPIVEGTMWAVLVRGVVGRTLCERPVRLPVLGRGCLGLTACAGARLYTAGFDAALPLGLRVEASDTWVDPLVGLGVKLELGRRWAAGLVSDIGGFGVGSDLAWWLSATLEYRFSRHWSIWAGYSWLDMDHTAEGPGARGLTWNLRLSGPVLAVRYRF